MCPSLLGFIGRIPGVGEARGWLEECFPSTDLLPDKDNDPDGTQWIKSVGAGALGTTPVSGNFGFAYRRTEEARNRGLRTDRVAHPADRQAATLADLENLPTESYRGDRRD